MNVYRACSGAEATNLFRQTPTGKPRPKQANPDQSKQTPTRASKPRPEQANPDRQYGTVLPLVTQETPAGNTALPFVPFYWQTLIFKIYCNRMAALIVLHLYAPRRRYVSELCKNDTPRHHRSCGAGPIGPHTFTSVGRIQSKNVLLPRT